MHNKEFTHALILGSINISENDKIINLFSRELGRIDAIARGANSMKSKLRMSLSDFSLIDSFIIEGKSTSKIASVSQRSVYINENKIKNTFFVKIINLIKKYIQGSGEHARLFDKVICIFDFVKMNNLSESEIKCLAIFTTMLILADLGYYQLKDEYSFDAEIDFALIKKINESQDSLEVELKKILISTQV